MMAVRSVDVPALVDAARAGAPRAIARLISRVEDGHPALPLLLVAALAMGRRWPEVPCPVTRETPFDQGFHRFSELGVLATSG